LTSNNRALLSPPAPPESVYRRADTDINETALLEHLPPACARQAAGNSIGPQVDVADRRFRYRLAIRDVGKLQAPPRPQTRRISENTRRLSTATAQYLALTSSRRALASTAKAHSCLIRR